MADLFQNFPSNINSPAKHAEPVTPSDDTELLVASRKLYIGTGGDIVVDMVGGEANVQFSNAQSGSTLDIRVTKVKATGTTANNIVALW